MIRTRHLLLLSLLLSLSLSPAGCTRRMPVANLGTLDPSFLQRCTQGPGGLVLLDELFEDYWGRGYDNTKPRLLASAPGADGEGTQYNRMVVRRLVIKILSTDGAIKASSFQVVHYRENLPPVEVHAWMADGGERPVRVVPVGVSKPLADWPCQLGFPRLTTFRIATLEAGDTVEILTPVSGPDQQFWTFASEQFCTFKSRATFGHPDDFTRLDMSAAVVDASGGVAGTSAPGVYPPVFELNKPLMPISKERLPFVLRAPRCPGWSNLRGRIFHTPLFLARAGKVAGRELVNPFLLSAVENGEKRRRIQAAADWVAQHIALEPEGELYWMRWMPIEPADRVAKSHRGAPGSVAALTFRILEEAGLKPRLALLQTNPRSRFLPELPAPAQFDTLAVAVDDESGKTIWLLPGRPFDPEAQPPREIAGRQALVLERWYAERDQGGGTCDPEIDLVLSCQHATPEPVELSLVTIEALPAPPPAPAPADTQPPAEPQPPAQP